MGTMRSGWLAVLCLALFAQPAAAQQTATVVASATAPTADAAAWRADLRFFMDSVTRTHPAFFRKHDRAEAERYLTMLDARLEKMTHAETVVAFQRLVAMADDDHTTTALGFDPMAAMRGYPVRMAFFRDGLFVIAAAPEHATLIGSRVTRIGNVSADSALVLLSPYVSARNPSWTRARVTDLLVFGEALRVAGIAPSAASVTLVTELNGVERKTQLESTSGRPHPRLPAPPDWSVARPLQPRFQPDGPLSFGMLAGTRALYARFDRVGNVGPLTFADWTRNLFALADSAKPDRLILDVRMNHGGDNTLLAPLIKGVTDRAWLNAPASLFVLTGRETVSAAQNFATRMQNQTRATFIGEPTGSAPNHFGDPRRIRLPRTNVSVFISTRAWQDAAADDTRDTLEPSIRVEPAFAEWLRGFDPALEAALRKP